MNRIGRLFQSFEELPLLKRFAVWSGVGVGTFLFQVYRNDISIKNTEFTPLDAERVKVAHEIQNRLKITNRVILFQTDPSSSGECIMASPSGTYIIGLPKEKEDFEEFSLAHEFSHLKNWDPLKLAAIRSLTCTLVGFQKSNKMVLGMFFTTSVVSLYFERRSERNADIEATKFVSSSAEISSSVRHFENKRLYQMGKYNDSRTYPPLPKLAVSLTLSPQGNLLLFPNTFPPFDPHPSESERIQYLKEIYYDRGEFPQVQITVTGESRAIEPHTSEAIASIIRKSPHESLLIGADRISFTGEKVVIATRNTSKEYEVDSSTMDQLKSATRADPLLLEILTKLLLPAP